MSVRVLVADDQALIRDGLLTLLGTVADIEPVGAAANGQEAVRLAAELRPQVILMDLQMPELDGVGAIPAIRAAQPEIEIVVLTTHADDTSILTALGAGARGYLTKDAGLAEITRAVHAAAAGQSLLDPAVQARLLAAATRPAAAPGTGAGTPGPPLAGAEPVSRLRPQHDELTPRELEVLTLIAQGRSNAEIADTLVVSAATVKTHVNHVFAKIGVRDRAQAVHYAYTHGLAG